MKGEYEAKGKKMVKYVAKVQGAIRAFKIFEIHQVPRLENTRADALSKLTTSEFMELGQAVYIEELFHPSIQEEEVLLIEQELSWIDPIVSYLKEGTAHYYNSKVKKRLFRVRDLVLRRSEVSDPKNSGKLAPNWEGPYRVTKVVRPGTYNLETLGGKDIPRARNSENFKKYYQ